MYSGKTQNLELPQWGLDDYFQPIADLNPAFEEIDNLLGQNGETIRQLRESQESINKQLLQDMADIAEAKAAIEKSASDIAEVNTVIDGIKEKEAQVDAALEQVGKNITKLYNSQIQTIQDLTKYVDAETKRAQAQEELIDSKATAASVAAADAQNLAETAKSFAEEAKNSALNASVSAENSKLEAERAKESAQAVQEDFESNVKPQVQEAKDAAQASKEASEAASRQATLSAGYASNAARDAASAKEKSEQANTTAASALATAALADAKATKAANDASMAAQSASEAAQKATDASESASAAQASATAAESQAITAGEKATAAEESAAASQAAADEAKAQADAAKLSADNAAQSAADAAASAEAAQGSATAAETKAGELETEFNRLKSEDWETYKAGIDENIEQLRGEVGSGTAEVGTLTERVGTLETDVTGLKSSGETLGTDVEGLKSSVETLNTDVEAVEGKLLGVDGPIATQSYVDEAVAGVQVDDSNYAKLNAQNTFTAAQTISDSGDTLKLAAGTGIEFRSQTAMTSDAVATISSDGVPDNTRLVVSTPLKVGEPSADTDAATKKYVDDQIATVQPVEVDTTNLAKLDGGNTFTGDVNIFNGGIQLPSGKSVKLIGTTTLSFDDGEGNSVDLVGSNATDVECSGNFSAANLGSAGIVTAQASRGGTITEGRLMNNGMYFRQGTAAITVGVVPGAAGVATIQFSSTDSDHTTRLKNVKEPVDGTDAVNKSYFDSNAITRSDLSSIIYSTNITSGTLSGTTLTLTVRAGIAEAGNEILIAAGYMHVSSGDPCYFFMTGHNFNICQAVTGGVSDSINIMSYTYEAGVYSITLAISVDVTVTDIKGALLFCNG